MQNKVLRRTITITSDLMGQQAKIQNSLHPTGQAAEPAETKKATF